MDIETLNPLHAVMQYKFYSKFAAVLFANKFFVITLHIIIFLILIKITNKVIRKVIDKVKLRHDDIEFEKQADTLKSIVISVADTILGCMMFMYVLNKLGIDIRPILTAAGIVGVAVGFGAKRFVEDVITGMIILIEGQIRVGDVVEIAGKTGVVEKLDLKLVVLRDLEGHVHFIRNGMIDIVTNMTREYSYYVFKVAVAYDTNIDKVTNTLEELGREFCNTHELGKDVLEPLEILGVDEFADSAVIIKARFKTKPIKQWAVGRAFNKLMKDKFDELNIEIPVPHRKILQ